MVQQKLLDEQGDGLRRRRRLGIRRGLLRKENREEGSENRAKGEALVEGVDVGVMGNQVEDVDEVEGCGVEEIAVDGEAGDVGC